MDTRIARRGEWIEECRAAITVCDVQGNILDMNAKAAEVFTKYGGTALIGKSLLDCHPEPARTKLRGLLDSGEANIYTIEKDGQKKLIYQMPWYADGRLAGLVELSLEIPFAMPHFVRE